MKTAYLAASLSGLLLTLSFPTVIGGVHLPNLSMLAWVALVPLVVVCRRAPLHQVALLHFVTGLIYNALVSYWIFYAMYRYGGIPFLASVGGVLGMASIFGFILAVAGVLIFAAQRRLRMPLAVIFPIGWVLHEWVRNYVPFGGYPWSQLGYTQASHLTLIQLADICGVYGLSLLIVVGNGAVAEVVEFLTKRRRMPWLPVGLSLLLIMGTLGYGQWRLSELESMIPTLPTARIAVVQPNIPQEIKWRPEQAKQSVRELRRLSAAAAVQGAELVLWPESAYPDVVPTVLSQLDEFAELPVTILTGVVSVRLERDPRTRRPLLQNSALQLNPAGQVTGWYSKVHLVPFGEYIPLKWAIGSFDKIVPAIGDFVPGRELIPIEWKGSSYGVTICYEDLFPEISRALVRNGADFLTNITNDAWYADSSAQWQHLTFSQLRAVENRRSVVRSTNTGVTAVIDATGAIQQQLPPFEAGLLVTAVRLGGPESLYTRFGDSLWLGLLGLVLVLERIIHNKGKNIAP